VELIGVSESSLPESPNRLIGSAEESERIINELTDGRVRLLTISGAGGIGKTRLALEVARILQSHFQHGTRFVALAACREPALVLSAILREVAPGEPTGRRHELDVLKRILSGLRLLLVLDNFEQVLEAAPVVSELLATCAGLSVLVTSRAPLRLTWEHDVQLGPLAIPAAEVDPRHENVLGYPSVALLVERLRAAGVETNGNRDAPLILAAICRRLDGIPLAIELAAVRARILGLSDLLARLERPLELLAVGPRDAPPRHQALRLTFGWSYELLADSDRRIFRHLGVFVGGCTYETAARVCDASFDDMEFLDGLERVVESGLVTRVEPIGSSERRLVLLEPVREYALERLQESDEADLAGQRHATAYLELCELADRSSLTPSGHRWASRLNREHANSLAALRWFLDQNDAEGSVRLAVALSKFWWVSGFMREGLERLDRALELAAQQSHSDSLDVARLAGLLAKSWGLLNSGDYAAAETFAEVGLALCGDEDQLEQRAFAMRLLGDAALARGDLDRAESLHNESLKLYGTAANEIGMARGLMDFGRIAWIRGQYDRACALLTECVPRLTAADDHVCTAHVGTGRVLSWQRARRPGAHARDVLNMAHHWRTRAVGATSGVVGGGSGCVRQPRARLEDRRSRGRPTRRNRFTTDPNLEAGDRPLARPGSHSRWTVGKLRRLDRRPCAQYR
jgi:predicted ATPase